MGAPKALHKGSLRLLRLARGAAHGAGVGERGEGRGQAAGAGDRAPEAAAGEGAARAVRAVRGARLPSIAGDDHLKTSGRAGDDFFAFQGRAFVTCLLSDLVFGPDLPRSERTLTFWQRLTEREIAVKERLAEIYEKSASYQARDLAGSPWWPLKISQQAAGALLEEFVSAGALRGLTGRSRFRAFGLA